VEGVGLHCDVMTEAETNGSTGVALHCATVVEGEVPGNTKLIEVEK